MLCKITSKLGTKAKAVDSHLQYDNEEYRGAAKSHKETPEMSQFLLCLTVMQQDHQTIPVFIVLLVFKVALKSSYEVLNLTC